MKDAINPLEKEIQQGIYATLSIKQFKEIAEFAKKHHPVAMVIKENELLKTPTGFKDHYRIKYIESSLDAADLRIWYVTFKGVGINIRFCMQNLDDLPEGMIYTTLYDWIMAFLKGAWVPSEKMLRGKKGVDNIL